MQLGTTAQTIQLVSFLVGKWQTFCRLAFIASTAALCWSILPTAAFGQSNAISYNLPLVVAPGEQLAPVLVGDNSGGAFVIWQDKRDGRAAIYAQYLNSLSQPVWKQNGVAVAAVSKDQFTPVAISDGKGGVLIFWQDLRNDEGDIYGQHLDHAGNLLWGTSGAPVIRAGGKQSGPKAASDGQNGAFVVCRDFKSGKEDVTAQRIEAGGNILLDLAGKALATGSGSQILGDVAATPDAGFILAWSDHASGLPRVLAQRFDAKVNAQWPLNVAVAVVRSAQIAPVLHVANDDRGTAFVVWVDNRNRNLDLYAQKISANGLAQWGLLGLPLCNASEDQYNHRITGDGSDGILAVWEDERSRRGDIYGQALTAAGQARWQNDGVAIATSNQKKIQPQLVADGSGGLICVWSDDRGSGDSIGAQHLSKDGKALWEANGIFITNANGTKQWPTILAQPGNFLGATGSLVAWEDDRRGNEDIFVQPLHSDGALANVPPLITSSPVTEAQEGRLYSYQIQALDYDSADPLWLELVAPANGTWLQVDGAKLQLFGTPMSSNAGEIAVTLQVKDKLGAAATQSFAIKVVAAANHPPQITSIPDTVATEDQVYAYKIVAADPDPNEVLTLMLETDAAWLKLTDDGQITGMPENQHVGSYKVTARATDKKGATVAQEFSLRVKNVNDTPFFISKPDTITFVDSLYVYRVAAGDPDRGDAVQIIKREASAWLNWNTSTRTLQGKPGLQHFGNTYPVLLDARDAAGATTVQSFRIKVLSNNHAPQITSTPDTVALEDRLYSYKIVATDPDAGETLTFALETEANWLRLTNDGRLTGTPANEHVADYAVSLRVSDKQGAVALQKFLLRVQNVNDPPFFTSQPDTFAFVDSLYVYRATAADVDRGDDVQISKRIVPAWLTWNEATRALEGKPNLQHLGIYSVTLLTRDAAGATTEQTFRLRVISLTGPDTFVPASPQALRLQPAGWSANKKFTLSWKNPIDPSRIAGAYYKIGSPPAHDRDGVLVASAAGQPIEQLEFTATKEGKAPVYVWLVDGRNNVDFRTAVNVAYYHDATAPQPPQNLSPHRQWRRSDSLRFQWTPATDAVSGIRRYQVFLDNNFLSYIARDTNSMLLILRLAEKAYSWAVMAEDSAGNLSAKATAVFSVDRLAPVLIHTAMDTAIAQTDLIISAQAQDALAGVREVRIYYRTAGEAAFQIKNLWPANSSFSTRLGPAEVLSKGLEYYLDAADSAGNRTRWPGNASNDYHAVVIASQNVVAAAPLAMGRYQIISAPYRLRDHSPAWLEDDLGSYEPTAWRLFCYRADEGNVEFGQANFENFSPGRAFWLITNTPKQLDTGPAHSIKSDTPFDLALQPGWNLIATPFDFPTSWLAAVLPEGVEDNLWAFDGSRYVEQQEVLQPWQGYFLRNLETTPQTITIFPVENERLTKPPSPATEIFWQVQLRISDGEFRDDANYLGMAPDASETWDRRDHSEPPGIGEHVSLHFDRRDWPRYAGLFTSDFRPVDPTPQKWSFTTVASRAGLPVELSWNYSGDLPKDWIFVLEDVDGNLRRRIKPGDNDRYIFRAASQPRRFVWWAGREEQLAEVGALQNFIPAVFELRHYPNPARLSGMRGRSEVNVIRFGLPFDTEARLTIFDLAGRRVRLLVAGKQLTAGYHEVQWDGFDEAGRATAAGIYLYRLETAAFSASRKLILLR